MDYNKAMALEAIFILHGIHSTSRVSIPYMKLIIKLVYLSLTTWLTQYVMLCYSRIWRYWYDT